MSRVVVVGAGIAGLSAAWELQAAGVDVQVFEQRSEAGGRMRSVQHDGVWIDLGAEAITSIDTGLAELADELGMLGDRIEYPGGAAAFDVWRGDRAFRLALTEPLGFLRYGALGWGARLRLAALAPVLARQAWYNRGAGPWEPTRAAWCDDRSVEAWLGALNRDALEYAIEPFYEFYTGCSPGDVGRGMFAYLATTYRNASTFTFRQGLGQLTRTLAARLDVHTETTVTRVRVGTPTVVVDLRVGDRETSVAADAVVVAVPGIDVAGLVDGLDADRVSFLAHIRYVPYDLPYYALVERPDGMPSRLVYPRAEDPHLASVGYGQSTTEPSVSFLRAILKSGYLRRHVDRPDDEHLQAILAEIARRFPEVPSLVRRSFISRWRHALPKFGPGYLHHLARFESLRPLRNIAFAGDYLAAPATGAAHATGRRAARQILDQLS